MSQQLNNKVIAVTGGSKGLGLAAAKSLVAMGAKVALLARGQADLEKAVAELGAENAFGVSVDVADKNSVETAFNTVFEHYGRLDGVVNNAGLARPNPVETLPVDDLLLQINTNFVGVVYCCQAAIPLLRKTGSGLLLNISSATVRHENEMSHLSIYAATKAAVDVFSRELREELKNDLIGVTVLSPGAVMTEFGFGWDMSKLSTALHAWQEKGPKFDGNMEAEHIGQAVAHCFTYPPGVTVDFIEVKPHKPTDKPLF